MDPVAHTARWTAALRAQESDRPDALFRDPLARALADEEGFAMLAASQQALAQQLADIGTYIALRTRFFDDFALRTAGEGVRQVVILAAGMDARAFRLSWPPGTTLYEIDQPGLLELKESILQREDVQAACRRIPLGVDLNRPWVPSLLAAGFVPQERSLWLAEGILYYLAEQSVHDLLGQVSSVAAPGSRLGADLVSASFFTSPWMQPALRAMEERGMPWRFGTDEPEALLAAYGWQAHARQPGEEGAHY